ncbi:MAG TPA: site-specific integrase [Flavobacterium sp.]|jgi:site-specific recombinase XerD
MKLNKISILFYAKKSKATKNGQLPIYLRVTLNGVRIELSTSKMIDLSQWSVKEGRMKGNSEEARAINGYLDSMRFRVYETEGFLVRSQMIVNADTFKNQFLGVAQKERMLIPIFKEHNSRMKELIGKEFSSNTYKRYETTLDHIQKFLKYQYRKNDIPIKEVNLAFINDLDFYFRSVRNCNNNSTIKYVRNFGKIIKSCYANEWIDRDPFLNFKGKVIQVDREHLTQDEINGIYFKEFSTQRLNQVKDIFIFCCYTGLAYIDVYQLKTNDIEIGVDGRKWICSHRQKTKTATRIPLLAIPQELMAKYADHPQCINEERILPVLSNQKMNSYLKEIADVCGITKELTFHIARHTFATTVTLSNGVPIESVSKMLGHKTLRTTQHYAKILDKKVSEDMFNLGCKLDKIQESNIHLKSI